MQQLVEGDLVPEFSGTAASGRRITSLGLRGTPLLLQFHRFATCPACFLSMHAFTRRVGELRDAGLELVAFFYSTPEALAESFKDLAPDFELVGDPDRVIFDRFGVERSVRKFLKAKVLGAGVKGWTRGAAFEPISNLTKEDTSGVPADFVVDADGVVRHVHYGSHAADSMSVDEVLGVWGRFRPQRSELL